VPDVDSDYRLRPRHTLAILAGFAKNRRVMSRAITAPAVDPYRSVPHGTACVRVNLDSHISRIDLVGKGLHRSCGTASGHRIRDGILPWALQHNIALVFDEYDAGRPT